MRTESRVLVVGLVALLSACHQSAGSGPPATGVSGVDAPRFAVLQETSAFAEQEAAILAGINGYRAQHGLAALTESADLCRLSRAHATDMVNRNYFSHINPEGKGPYQRLQAAGIDFAYYAATNSYASIRADAVIADWATHPGKHFMLDSRLTQCGVGVAGPAANGRYRVTATYIRPKLSKSH
jgi:uncharacterized protein YkwD